MSLLLFKILAVLVILLISLLAGLKSLRLSKTNPEHRLVELGDAFGSGIFLGIAFFHMLPVAQTDLLHAYGILNYPYANLLCISGFVVLLFLEIVILWVNDTQPGKQSLVPYILPIVLSVHALIEGAALGINTTLANVVLIFIAIIVHKGSESFALATHLGRSHLMLARSMPIFLLWVFMSPLGILLGSLLAEHQYTHSGMITAAVFNAFAAGTFIYIATLHKTVHWCRSKYNDHFVKFLLLVLGLLLMAVAEVWL